MAEILGEHIDKKHLLYIGGAIASIGALIWIMRRNAGSQTAGTVQPVRTSGGAAGGAGTAQSDAALRAAEIQAATALSIEQGREQLQREQIAAAREIALGQQYTQRFVAGVGSATSAFGNAVKGFASAAPFAFGSRGAAPGEDVYGQPSIVDNQVYYGQIYDEPIGPDLPGYGQIYDEPIGPGLLPGEEGFNYDAGYTETTGGGSSDWFGEWT